MNAVSPGFHGLEIALRSLSGAKAVRVVHGHGQLIGQHQHDWICVTLPVLGQALESWDGGEAVIGGPCVLLHPPGACHADRIGDSGLETVSIQFDPRWLSGFGFEVRLEKSVWWANAAGARLLARSWSEADTPAADLARITAAFLHRTMTAEPSVPPAWMKHVRRALRDTEAVTAARLAAQLDLHPAWLARAYRAAVGEGIQDTARRRRVETAVSLLRRTDLPLAQVAADCGFSDQSHMTRGFRTLIGRTPLQVRSERELISTR